VGNLENVGKVMGKDEVKMVEALGKDMEHI
jgi:hypothetical protein